MATIHIEGFDAHELSVTVGALHDHAAACRKPEVADFPRALVAEQAANKIGRAAVAAFEAERLNDHRRNVS